ncbi:MAG: hypothetical protein ACOYNL_01860 [Rickettsiales bacterium]
MTNVMTSLQLAVFILLPFYYLSALLFWCRTIAASPNRVRFAVALPFVLVMLSSGFSFNMSATCMFISGTLFCAAVYYDRHELRTYHEVFRGILIPTMILFLLGMVTFALMPLISPQLD